MSPFFSPPIPIWFNDSTATSKTQRINAASELIDWLRLVNQPLSPSQIGQLANQISKLHAPAIRDLVEYLDPQQSNIWDGLEVVSTFQAQYVIFILFFSSSYHSHSLDFSWLFLHAREDEIMDEKCRVVLCDSVFTQTPSLVDLVRVVRLIMHRLPAQQQSENEGAVTGLLLVLARIMKRSKVVLSPGEFTSLKAMVFEHHGVLEEMFMAGGPAQGALFHSVVRSFSDRFIGTKQLLEASLVATSETDRLLVSDIGRHWMDKLQLALLDNDSSFSVSPLDTPHFTFPIPHLRSNSRYCGFNTSTQKSSSPCSTQSPPPSTAWPPPPFWK